MIRRDNVGPSAGNDYREIIRWFCLLEALSIRVDAKETTMLVFRLSGRTVFLKFRVG